MADKKYIDADLLDELYHNQIDLSSTPEEAYEDATLDAIVHADVAKVKHGRWIEHESICECSECNGYTTWNYKYCPYCGARMDGE